LGFQPNIRKENTVKNTSENTVTSPNDGYERAWFVILKRADDLQEAMSYLRGFSEEALLSRNEIQIEIWIKRGLKNSIQQPANNS
jgi:hypothetical protein